MAQFRKQRNVPVLRKPFKGRNIPISNQLSRGHTVYEDLEAELSELPDTRYSPDDAELSEDEMEEPVFDLRSDDSDKSEGMDESDEDEEQLKGFTAKMTRQEKILRQKTGWREDEESEEEEERKEIAAWGKKKRMYYSADNVDYELQSSDEESPAEEEVEALRLQRLKAESLCPEDFGLDQEDNILESNEETLQDIVKRAEMKDGERKALNILKKAEEDTEKGKVIFVEKVRKDFNKLTKEEQMEVLRSDAPELVGLLLELRESLDEIRNKIEPALLKVKGGHYATKKGISYIEMKHALLLSYCQTIFFYLLLKAERQSVCDHPVIGRLVEIRELLEKIHPVDMKLQGQLLNLVNDSPPQSEKFNVTLETGKPNQNTFTPKTDKPSEVEEYSKERKLNSPKEVAFQKARTNRSLKDTVNVLEATNRESKEILGPESKEMLKEREQIEARVYQDDFLHMFATKKQREKHLKRSGNSHIRTLDDFSDDITNLDEERPIKAVQIEFPKQRKLLDMISAIGTKKPKVVSGDADVPAKDDIGMRRLKFGMQKLSKLHNHEDEGMTEDEDTNKPEEDQIYQETKKLRASKQAITVAKNARSVSFPEEDFTVGKRHISYEMEKNKGLTPYRKKMIKNPRKKYKVKHSKAVIRRKGQVRELRFPDGPYGGETTGIRANISRSIRFH